MLSKQKELTNDHIWGPVIAELNCWDGNEIESVLYHWNWRLMAKKYYVVSKGERREIVELVARWDAHVVKK